MRTAVENGVLAAERYEGFMKLDEEIENLKKRIKKRKMTLERRAKRDHRIKARNPEDRKEYEADLKPRA